MEEFVNEKLNPEDGGLKYFGDGSSIEKGKKHVPVTSHESQDNLLEDDPWELPEFKDTTKPWKEMSQGEKFKFVVWFVIKIVVLIGCLYLFICSLDFLSSAFKLLGGKAAGKAFAQNELLSNPVAGLMIGVLATVLVQSSSTTTSIVVSMVGAGIIPSVKLAIPIIMGANIGTSVTNTIVAVGQMANKNDFRRAFAGATVHDMFNWLSVFVFLPVELLTRAIFDVGFLEWLTGLMVSGLSLEKNENAKQELLKVVTKPFTNLIIEVDKKVIENIAKSNSAAEGQSLIKTCCKSGYKYVAANATFPVNHTGTTPTAFPITEMVKTKYCKTPCTHIFVDVVDDWSDSVIGIIVLVGALTILCVCLVAIVKLLHSILRGNIAKVTRKVINTDFPKVPWLTGYVAILAGAVMTILVQSSSIFTSAITPLVGLGVISIDRMYPLTLGANIGTTVTAVLAALAQDSDKIKIALQVALCHLFFNICGILVWYPVPSMRRPIALAKFLGNRTAKYRWFPFAYLIAMFFVLPAICFALSIPGWYVLLAVGGPILLLVVIVGIITSIQHRRPKCLPAKMQTWKWLPKFMRSLEPYDWIFSKLCVCCLVCKRCETSELKEVICETNVVVSAFADRDNKKVDSNGHLNQAYEKEITTLDDEHRVNGPRDDGSIDKKGSL